MRALSETASTLTIYQPVWIGLALLAVVYALSFWFLKGAKKSKSPMQQRAAGIFGIVIGSVVGFSAMTDGTTMDATGASETRMLHHRQSAAWAKVVEVTVEERDVGRRGMQPHVVLRLAPHGEMAVDVSRLDASEVKRVVAFAKSRSRK